VVVHVPPSPPPTALPYTTLFRSVGVLERPQDGRERVERVGQVPLDGPLRDAELAGDRRDGQVVEIAQHDARALPRAQGAERDVRSEEHTSERQSRENLVCRRLPG